MFKMDEKFFAELQRDCCWFTLPIFEQLPDIDPGVDITDSAIWSDDACVQRHIFAMTFGGFGSSVDLRRAKDLALIKLGEIEAREPKNKSIENPEFVKWLGLFARQNVLVGTIFAYLHDYPVAASCLMNGLKTRAVNLFMPYCDFIQYVLRKVAKIPAEILKYDGCGFSAEEPMGSILQGGGSLDAGAAELVISALEHDDGGIILFYRGSKRYGELTRLGSTIGKNGGNCIDIYEVLMLDRKFNVKKLRLYFNGYFSATYGATIRLPKGFSINPLSQAAKFFKVVK